MKRKSFSLRIGWSGENARALAKDSSACLNTGYESLYWMYLFVDQIDANYIYFITKCYVEHFIMTNIAYAYQYRSSWEKINLIKFKKNIVLSWNTLMFYYYTAIVPYYRCSCVKLCCSAKLVLRVVLCK